MEQEKTAVSSPSIITPTSVIEITNSSIFTSLSRSNNGLAVTTSISGDDTGLATAISTAGGRHPTGASTQFTNAPAHLGGGAIGGIVGGILGGLVVILSVAFCIRFASRMGRSLKWNGFKNESNVGGRTHFEEDNRINGEDNRRSGRPRDSKFGTASGRLEKDGGDYSIGRKLHH
jgi:hypothetical protein